MPVVALLTDFGTRDHYVGAMKGVILGICPEAALVDITHEIPPQDLLAASFELAACYRSFPAGSVFVVVVDPGVGSSRRALAAEAAGYRFVAPDNGVLTGVFDEAAPSAVVELTERRYALASISRTFEGRDRLAPAAAWLAAGTALAALGPPVADYRLLDVPRPAVGESGIDGEVVRIDRFGNLITNISGRILAKLPHPERARIEVGPNEVVVPLLATYADAKAGEICALVGSTDHLEVALSGGSAADTLRLSRRARVVVRPGLD